MELSEIFLTFTAIFGVGFFLGWRFREQVAVRRIEQVTEEISEDILQEFKSRVIDISVEDHDGTFYVYNRDDGAYLAHGPSMDKLEDILLEKFPGKLFNAKPDDLQKLKSR
jgi:hypothetical protein